MNSTLYGWFVDIWNINQVFKTLNYWNEKFKRERKAHHTNINQKTGEVALLISNKADFRTRKIISDKEEYYTMKKRSVLQRDITSKNLVSKTHEAKSNRTVKRYK